MLSCEQILQKITEDQILNIIKDMGELPYKIKDNEIWFRTICHGGNSHKLCYFRDSKDFYCYTNCGKMNLFSFLMEAKNLSFVEVVGFLSEKISRTGIGIDLFSGTNGKRSSLRKQTMEKLSNIESSELQILSQKLPQYSPEILNYFNPNVFYKGWIDDGISIESMEKYNIRWYELEKHIIIPHYDINGNLIGIRRRSLQEKDQSNKYMPEILEGKSYAHPLGYNLYGLYQNKDIISKIGRVIICEGEKSVLLGDTYYGDENCIVATCGFNVSLAQIKLLKNLKVKEVFLAFDKDFEPKDFIKSDNNLIEYNKSLFYKKKIELLEERIKNNLTSDVRIVYDKYDLTQKKDCPFDRGKKIADYMLFKSLGETPVWWKAELNEKGRQYEKNKI